MKLRDKVLELATKNERHYTATWFLSALSFTMICVAINRHWELDKAQQHDKLTECQNRVMELVEMKGKYSVYKDLTGNNSVAVAKNDQINGMLKDQLSKEAEYHEDCKKNLKSVRSELQQTEKKVTTLLVEKEKQKGYYKTCSDELAKCSQNLKQ